MEVILFLIIFFFIILPIMLVIDAFIKSFPEGTYEERDKDPNLNTTDWEHHWRRLQKFGFSKYRQQTYYLGPKGGYYYYSANGNKVYC